MRIFFSSSGWGVLLKIEWWQVYVWLVHKNSNKQLWITYYWCELQRDIWNLCRDGKGVDRYWCLKPTSCFSFFYFCLYEAVNICPHLANPFTNFKCLSVIRIINMLSIIVHYYFCVRSTHEPVITWSLWAPPVHKWKKNILIDDYVKIPAEFFAHCQNFYETFEVPAGCGTKVSNPESQYVFC